MSASAPLLFALPGFGSLLPRSASGERGAMEMGRFANREMYVRLHGPVEGRRCHVLGGLTPPGPRLAELLLVCDTLSRNGAAAVHLLAPYLAYARQDREQPQQSVAIGWVGRLLRACGVRDVTTIDLHSEQAGALLELPVRSLSPAPLLAPALAGSAEDGVVVVAPDEGAIERAGALAGALGIDASVAWVQKRRTDEGIARLGMVGELAPHAIVVDDILDTGATLISCTRALRERGVRRIDVAVTHGLFTGRRWQELPRLGVAQLHVTDSVPAARARRSATIQVHAVAPLLEAALAR